MQVVWLDDAKKQLKTAVSYGTVAFGKKATTQFVTEVQKNNDRLKTFPFLGKKEPLLDGLKREYRSLVVYKHYKIIYYVDDMIFIVALWDTRGDQTVLGTEID